MYGRAIVMTGGLLAAACGGSSTSGNAPPDATPADAGARPAPPPRPAPPEGPATLTGPAHLSETGLYADIATRKIADGLIAFTPRWSFWTDGAEKDRHLYLPPGTTIDTTDMDFWTFPVGTKLWKEFKVDGKVVETRLLWKQRSGGLTGKPEQDGWFAVAYVWRPDGSDADAAPNGVENVAGTTHDVPPQLHCTNCHMSVADVGIGVSALQLSADDGHGQLTAFAAAGRLSNPPAHEFQVPGAGVVKDALTYLHANCGHCHSGLGPLGTQTAMRLRVRTTDATPEDTFAYTTHATKTRHIDTGTDTVIVPGDPDKSQLWVLMSARRVGSMPPYSTKVVDPAESVVRDWILGLPH